MNKLKSWLQTFWREEDGLGTLEILLIVAVLVAIAIIFRKWIVHWFNQLIGNANTDLKDSSVIPCNPASGANCAQ
ncbi:Flp1 family type IVb pilin [Paenibacillus eucommiae]|uniref:Flp pilus assembly pilin Flp n=1 Tax=Paenibacillus eucommiae TaxID=1355755 RepID=A0ABS4J5W8_9BACL|nr:Flp1 family type IVb pilin [Paenibacillus eucommiae]MBP1995242.1 Flp pilus assembly pilin Flp [Paenibacillus eucommiae]